MKSGEKMDKYQLKIQTNIEKSEPVEVPKSLGNATQDDNSV